LGLLVAVELLPDLMRTVGNVASDTAVATVIDRRYGREPGSGAQPSASSSRQR